MKNCIVNFEDLQIVSRLQQFGYNCTPVIKSDKVSAPICAHADVLYNKISNDTIIASSCQRANFSLFTGYNVIENDQLKSGYNTECLLNFIVNDKYVIRNPKTSIDFPTDKKVIFTKQGYTKCSCLCVNDDSYITGDVGIYKALGLNNINCLLIDDSNIVLKGYDHGFIGGASVKLNDREILFFGDIEDKDEKNKIINFIKDQNMLCHFIENKKMVDIGSALIF